MTIYSPAFLKPLKKFREGDQIRFASGGKSLEIYRQSRFGRRNNKIAVQRQTDDIFQQIFSDCEFQIKKLKKNCSLCKADEKDLEAIQKGVKFFCKAVSHSKKSMVKNYGTDLQCELEELLKTILLNANQIQTQGKKRVQDVHERLAKLQNKTKKVQKAIAKLKEDKKNAEETYKQESGHLLSLNQKLQQKLKQEKALILEKTLELQEEIDGVVAIIDSQGKDEVKEMWRKFYDEEIVTFDIFNPSVHLTLLLFDYENLDVVIRCNDGEIYYSLSLLCSQSDVLAREFPGDESQLNEQAASSSSSSNACAFKLKKDVSKEGVERYLIDLTDSTRTITYREMDQEKMEEKVHTANYTFGYSYQCCVVQAALDFRFREIAITLDATLLPELFEFARQFHIKKLEKECCRLLLQTIKEMTSIEDRVEAAMDWLNYIDDPRIHQKNNSQKKGKNAPNLHEECAKLLFTCVDRVDVQKFLLQHTWSSLELYKYMFTPQGAEKTGRLWKAEFLIQWAQAKAGVTDTQDTSEETKPIAEKDKGKEKVSQGETVSVKTTSLTDLYAPVSKDIPRSLWSYITFQSIEEAQDLLQKYLVENKQDVSRILYPVIIATLETFRDNKRLLEVAKTWFNKTNDQKIEGRCKKILLANSHDLEVQQLLLQGLWDPLDLEKYLFTNNRKGNKKDAEFLIQWALQRKPLDQDNATEVALTDKGKEKENKSEGPLDVLFESLWSHIRFQSEKEAFELIEKFQIDDVKYIRRIGLTPIEHPISPYFSFVPVYGYIDVTFCYKNFKSTLDSKESFYSRPFFINKKMGSGTIDCQAFFKWDNEANSYYFGIQRTDNGKPSMYSASDITLKISLKFDYPTDTLKDIIQPKEFTLLKDQPLTISKKWKLEDIKQACLGDEFGFNFRFTWV